MGRLKFWLRISVLLIGMVPQPTRAAIECDARNYDTLCHVYLPVIIGGEREN